MIEQIFTSKVLIILIIVILIIIVCYYNLTPQCSNNECMTTPAKYSGGSSSAFLPYLGGLVSSVKKRMPYVLKYYVVDSNIDPTFKVQVNKIVKNNLDHRLKEVQNRSDANVTIELNYREDLNKFKSSHDKYPDGTPIFFSYTSFSLNPLSINSSIHIDHINWLKGVSFSGLTLEQYRQYVVLHEFGHALGYDHMKIDAPTLDNRTPIMFQSTRGVPNGVKAGYMWNVDESQLPLL